jgi:hypothetical protein
MEVIEFALAAMIVGSIAHEFGELCQGTLGSFFFFL